MRDMTIPPWAILSLAQVPLTTRRLFAASPNMVMQGFSVDVSDDGKPCGQVLFGCDCPEGQVAAAWHWVEWAPGVMCIEDPCSVLSNVAVLDDDGDPVSSPMQVAHVNSLIYLLPWQQEVGQCLRQLEELRVAA
jgi:hypothetical protein